MLLALSTMLSVTFPKFRLSVFTILDSSLMVTIKQESFSTGLNKVKR